MTTRLKTAIAVDISALVDGQDIDAADFVLAHTSTQTYLREGNVAATDDDTHVKSLINAIKPVAPIATKEATDVTHGKQVEVYFSGTLPPANGGAGANTSAISGIPKLASGVVSAAVAETDYVTPTGAGTLQNKTLASNCAVPLEALVGTGASIGDVPTWNGTDYTPAPPGTGGALPKDLTVTAGENLAQRDYIFLNTSDNKWYKADNDDVTKIGLKRGFVTQTGGIATNASGTARVDGEVTGFSGLTAWADVYLSSTAGGITQTKPTVSAGGGQRQLIKIGYATATSKIMVEPFHPIEFLKRESLANAAFMTITHVNDPQARSREIHAYLSSTEAGAAIVAYGSGNQDSRVALRGATGAGGTTTIDSGGITGAVLGDSGGSEYRLAQSFQVTTGVLSQITVYIGSNFGSPTGALTWEVRTNNTTIPSATVLQSGTHTITPSSDNIITVTNGVQLVTGTTYWLVLSVPAQSTGNYYQPVYNTANPYANGVLKQDVDGANTWGGLGGNADLRCTVTTSATTTKDKLSQSFTLASNSDIDRVILRLRKVGSPAGTAPVRIETNSGGSASGTLANVNATATFAESGVSTSDGDVIVDFATNFTLSAGTYHVVLSTDRAASGENYIEWAADSSSPSLSGGEMKSESSATWNAESKDAIFELTAPGVVYDQKPSLGLWSGGANIGVQFGDGSAANQNTTTSFKNFIGSTQDITAVVKLL